MSGTDSLRNHYDMDVSFVPGESVRDTKLNNWDGLLIEPSFEFICSVIGDITHYQKNSTYPPFVTNLAKAIGTMDQLSPLYLASLFVYRITVPTSGVRELELPVPPDQTYAADPKNAISTSNDPAINLALPNRGYVATMPAVTGYWTILKDGDGNLTNKVVTFAGLTSGSLIAYQAERKGGLSSAYSYLNVIPTVVQVGLGDGVTVAVEGDNYRITFPQHRVGPDGTVLPTTLTTDPNQRCSLPDWYLTIPGSENEGDAYPDGLLMIWDQEEKAFVFTEDEANPVFYHSSDEAYGVLVSGTGLDLEECDDRYAIVVAGNSIGMAIQVLYQQVRDHDHTSYGKQVAHKALKGLIPNPETPNKFGPSVLGDHPDYLYREGRQTDSANTNNDMMGEIRMASATYDGGWEVDTKDSQPIGFGAGAISLRGRYLGSPPAGESSYRHGFKGDLDGYDGSAYFALLRMAGANFLPTFIVSPRAHATPARVGSRVFGTIQDAVDAATGGEVIWLEDGIYNLSSPVTISVNNLRIAGASGAIVTTTSALDCLFQLKEALNMQVTGIRIITTGSMNAGACGILIGDSSDSSASQGTVIDRCVFLGTYVALPTKADGIKIGSYGLQTKITNCSFGGVIKSPSALSGILDYGDGTTVTGCAFGSDTYPMSYYSYKRLYTGSCTFNFSSVFAGNTVYAEVASADSDKDTYVPIIYNASPLYGGDIRGARCMGNSVYFAPTGAGQSVPTFHAKWTDYIEVYDNGFYGVGLNGLEFDTCEVGRVERNTILTKSFRGLVHGNCSQFRVADNVLVGCGTDSDPTEALRGKAIVVGAYGEADTSSMFDIYRNNIVARDGTFVGYGIYSYSTTAPSAPTRTDIQIHHNDIRECYYPIKTYNLGSSNIYDNTIITTSGVLGIEQGGASSASTGDIYGNQITIAGAVVVGGILVGSNVGTGVLKNNRIMVSTSAVSGDIYGAKYLGDTEKAVCDNVVTLGGSGATDCIGVWWSAGTSSKAIFRDNKVRCVSTAGNATGVSCPTYAGLFDFWNNVVYAETAGGNPCAWKIGGTSVTEDSTLAVSAGNNDLQIVETDDRPVVYIQVGPTKDILIVPSVFIGNRLQSIYGSSAILFAAQDIDSGVGAQAAWVSTGNIWRSEGVDIYVHYMYKASLGGGGSIGNTPMSSIHDGIAVANGMASYIYNTADWGVADHMVNAFANP